KNTFLRCQSFYSKLNRFVELYDPSCSIERVDKEFIEAFNKYLKREGLNLNSRYSFVNLLKWFLSWALKEGMLINDDFRKFSLKSLSKGEMDEPPPLYLVWEELVKIYNSDPGSRRLEHCRDIYCFMAFTGCKLDELQKLGKSDIEKDYIIINGKNSRRIAMNSFSKKITEQYMNKYYRRGDLFPYYTKMTLNKYIRELCVFLNFEREVKIRRGGKVLISAISKLITINSAKPTFYANAVKMGLSPGLIQLWTGNESLSSYKRIKKDIRKQENENITIINKYYEDTL
ncbi:MAG: phage integrase SAM-like domain-containing protein, partial [Bacteroidota bacterium]